MSSGQRAWFRLHRLIEADLPASPRGLVATWQQIGMILQKQAEDPTYQFVPELSPRRGRMALEAKEAS